MSGQYFICLENLRIFFSCFFYFLKKSFQRVSYFSVQHYIQFKNLTLCWSWKANIVTYCNYNNSCRTIHLEKMMTESVLCVSFTCVGVKPLLVSDSVPCLVTLPCEWLGEIPVWLVSQKVSTLVVKQMIAGVAWPQWVVLMIDFPLFLLENSQYKRKKKILIQGKIPYLNVSLNIFKF